jgi:putative ABC transport system substrate-binding protein
MRPKMKRLGILNDDGASEAEMSVMREVQAAAAKRLGLERVDIIMPTTAGAARLEKAIREAKVDALDVALSNDSVPWAKDAMRIVERLGILASWDNRARVNEGGLLSVEGDSVEAIRAAVRIAAQVLHGAKPGEIPVYESRGVVISINMRTAQAMGLAVPESVLLQARNVVR